MKILFLINNLAGGGAERVLVNLVNRLDPTRYEVTLRTLFNEGENRNRLDPSVKYESVFGKSFRGVNILGRLPGRFVYNRVAYGEFDVIVVYLHGVLTRIVSRAPAGQRKIAYLHANMKNSPFMKSFGNRKNIQDCFGTYDAIVSVSKSVQSSFGEVSGITEKLHVLYNVFDVDTIRAKAQDAIDMSLLADAPIPNICSVGKLTQVKGYDRLLRVVARMRDEGLQFNLLIVGDGPLRGTLQQFIDTKGLADCVKLVGHDENPYKFISRCDLFVSPSYSEGFSSVVVESVVLGIPVLATDCSGMKEILGENQEHGVVVDNAEESLLHGMRELIGDRRKLEHYRERAAIRSEMFAPQQAVRNFEDLVAMVMERGTRS